MATVNRDDHERKCMEPTCNMQATKWPCMVIPLKNWRIPLLMQMREGLCDQHAAAFNINKYTDYDGHWYDWAVSAAWKHRRKCTDPMYPWLPAYWVQAKWVPVPKEQCYLIMRPFKGWEPKPQQPFKSQEVREWRGKDRLLPGDDRNGRLR